MIKTLASQLTAIVFVAFLALLFTLSSFTLSSAQRIATSQSEMDRSASRDSWAANRRPSPTPTPVPTPIPGCASVVANTNLWTGSGRLDPSFGFGGIAMTNVSTNPGSNTVREVLVQGDGKVITVGHAANGLTQADMLVIRYNADGTRDTGFGSPDPAFPGLRLGYRFVDFSGGLDSSSSALLDPAGNIVISGHPSTKIARLTPNGDMDPTFGGGDGKIEVGIADLVGGKIILQSNRKILVTGGEPNFTVARFNADGSLDTSFGTGGRVSVDINGSKGREGTNSLATQWISGQERIVVAGTSAAGPSTAGRATLLRLTSTGQRDASFGNNGVVFTSFYGLDARIFGIAIDLQNRIVATGQVYTPCGRDAGYSRYWDTGQLDTSFSGDGWLTHDIYGGVNYAEGLVIQPDGRILSAGFAQSADASVTDFAITRMLDDGSPDPAFGPANAPGPGVVTTSVFTTSGNFGTKLALQSNGNIVFGGSGGGNSIAARYLP